MSYIKKTWANGDDVTPTDFNRIETGIADNDNKINVCFKNVNRSNIDLNSIYNTGTQGYCTSCTNTPTGSDGFYVDYHSQYDNVGYQEFISYIDGSKFARHRNSNNWSAWVEIDITKSENIILNGYAPSFLTPKVARTNKTLTISGDVQIQNPVDWTVIGTLPQGFYPPYSFHIYVNSYTVDIPHYGRLWVTTDGRISTQGLDNVPSCTIEFDRTIIF